MESVSNANVSAYSNRQLQFGTYGSNAAKTSNAMSSGNGNTTTKSSQESLTSQLGGLVSLTRYAMDAMGLDSNSKVTFTQLTKYQSQVEEEFNNILKENLQKQGVSNIPDFTLKLNEDGTATVYTGSEHKDAIQKVFDENPELVKSYQKIEALAGIEKAREAMQIAPSEMRKRIQIEAMASWWAQSNTNGGNSFSSYSNGSLALLQGINKTV